jgi:hypothetical protein
MLDSFRRTALLGVALACASCSDENKTTGSVPDPSGERGPDAGAQPSDGGARGDEAPAPPLSADAAPEPVSPTANGSFETARPVTVGGKREFQDVVQPFQSAYFSFEAKAGSFYELASYVTPYSPENVLSLYDPDHVLIGENELGERWPGDRMLDTRLVVRLERDGTYYVKLTDPALGPEAFQNPAFPDYFYYLSARELTPGTPGTGFESEVDFALDDFSGYSVVTLVGEFHDRSNGVFNFAGKDGQALIGRALASGVHGNGSTAGGGLLQVSSENGTILAGIDRAEGQSAIHPPIGGGSYTFTVVPTGNLGENAFYAVDFVMLPENPLEQSTGDNGTIATAQPIDMKGAFPRRGLLLATIDGSDVDYFSFDAKAQETVLVACEAESAGSGIRSLHAEVRDADDAVLASAVETPIANLFMTPFVVDATGPHYLRIWSESASDSPIEHWVRCVVNAGP